MGDGAQRLRSLAALAQPERLDLGGLVQHHGLVGPPVAPVGHQPDQLLVVGGVDVGGRPDGLDALLLRPGDDRDVDVLQVGPLQDLRGPRGGRHAQRGHDEHRAVLDQLQAVQRRQGGHRLACAHASPHRAARRVDDVVDDQVLVGPGYEFCSHVFSTPKQPMSRTQPLYSMWK